MTSDTTCKCLLLFSGRKDRQSRPRMQIAATTNWNSPFISPTTQISGGNTCFWTNVKKPCSLVLDTTFDLAHTRISKSTNHLLLTRNWVEFSNDLQTRETFVFRNFTMCSAATASSKSKKEAKVHNKAFIHVIGICTTKQDEMRNELFLLTCSLPNKEGKLQDSRRWTGTGISLRAPSWF